MPDLKNKSVLISDQDSPTRSSLSEVLNQAGVNTKETTDEHGLFNSLQILVPHVIIVDILISPDDQEFRALKSLKESHVFSNVPTIVLVNQDDEKMIEKATSLGYNHLFFRPLESGKIISLVDDLIQNEVMSEIELSLFKKGQEVQSELIESSDQSPQLELSTLTEKCLSATTEEDISVGQQFNLSGRMIKKIFKSDNINLTVQHIENQEQSETKKTTVFFDLEKDYILSSKARTFVCYHRSKAK